MAPRVASDSGLNINWFYSSPERTSDISIPSNKNDILPAIFKEEVFMAIKVIKNRKVSEEDKLTVDSSKETLNEATEVLMNYSTNV